MLARVLNPGTLFGLLWSIAAHATLEVPDEQWFERDTQGKPQVFVYFFWSKQCPHCLDALPYLESLQEEYNWLSVKSYQLVGNPDHVRRYQLMARSLDKDARSVPAFLFCNTMLTGFDEHAMPEVLASKLQGCHDYLLSHDDLVGYTQSESATFQGTVEIDLPLFGKVTSTPDSLPLITLVIAGIDAFNPCAFFVLIFLLSMMLHTNSRKRMLLVGSIFVFFSGLLYFLFMTAWLNLFRVIGQLDVITMTAGLVALVIGLINAKEYFWFKKGLSLTIPDSAKHGIYHRVRALLRARSLYMVILATIGLAFFANLYEFLCTAGFPMVYTRVLTLNHLSDAQYYLYLALYNIIYVLPLFVIVLLTSLTLGRKKLQQQEGRSLKLVSGLMMIVLGGIILIEPNVLNNLVVTASLMLLALVLALTVIMLDKWRA